MRNINLPTAVQSLNVIYSTLTEKVKERGLEKASLYIKRHALRASVFIHRCQRSNKKYESIRNYKIAILEMDKVYRMVMHLYNRGIITLEELNAVMNEARGIRVATCYEIKEWYRFENWPQ